jgi:hypothetical protein
MFLRYLDINNYGEPDKPTIRSQEKDRKNKSINNNNKIEKIALPLTSILEHSGA